VSMEVILLVHRYHLVEQQVSILVKSLVKLVDKTEEGKFLLSIPWRTLPVNCCITHQVGTIKVVSQCQTDGKDGL
jgi:predicted lipid carrier protein YhbT